MNLEKVWRLESSADRLISTCLLPAAWVYAAGWLAYKSVYSAGLKKQKRFSPRIICVGNLEVGGLGKTPTCIAIAKLLSESRRKIAISASGYGSPAETAASLSPPGQLDPAKWGDEPSLIREKLPNLPLIIGRRRTLAAEIAEAEEIDVLILDDGFQHLPLARNVDLVMWNHTARNRRCLPAGPMREPLSGLKRASALLTFGDVPPGIASFRLVRRFPALRDLHTGERMQTSALAGATVRPLCAIGSPQRFLDTLLALDIRLSDPLLLPDHDPLDLHLPAEATWVVTDKDAVKLAARDRLPESIYALEMEVEFEEAARFTDWLSASLAL